MTTYEEKLALAEAEEVITEEEAEATGGAYFDEEMGLWIRQDADGGGIMPYYYQIDQVREGRPGDPKLITLLFIDLGHRDDVDDYTEGKGWYDRHQDC